MADFNSFNINGVDASIYINLATDTENGLMSIQDYNKLNELSNNLSINYINIDGEYITNGVISSSGEIITSIEGISLTLYHLYNYSVQSGQKIRIITKRGVSDNSYRAFAYAYYDSEPVELIILSTEQSCDYQYTIPEGVNNIYVYCNSSEISAPSVTEVIGTDVLETIENIQNELINNSTNINNIENTLQEYIFTHYDIDDMYTDSSSNKSYYWRLDYGIGYTPQLVKYSSNNSTEWGCMTFSVKCGQIIIIHTVGGGQARGYAFTDINKIIIAVADEGINTIDTHFEYTVTQDGYCFVNCTPNTNTDFSVDVYTSMETEIKYIEDIDERVKTIEDTDAFSVAPKFINPPIDIRNDAKSTLRVLDIGNSFTDDSTTIINDLITSTGIDVSDMCFYRCLRGGGSFKTFYDSWMGTDSSGYDISKLFGGLTQTIDGSTNTAKLHSCFIDTKWDLIIIHQVSTYSGEYDEWEGTTDAGYLKEFVRQIKLYQPQATIGYLMAHTSYVQSNETTVLWQKIVNSVQKMHTDYGIDFIIPVATAIENMRTSEQFKTLYPNVTHGYSCDGHHLGKGLAIYVANMTYFQCLLGQRYNTTIYGNSYRYEVIDASTYIYPDENISVTDENATLAQFCTINACNDMYNILSPDSILETI